MSHVEGRGIIRCRASRPRGGTSSEQFHLFFLLDVIREGLAVSLVPRLLACNTVLHPALATGGSVPLPRGWGLWLSLTKHSLVPPTPESHINVTTLCIITTNISFATLVHRRWLEQV